MYTKLNPQVCGKRFSTGSRKKKASLFEGGGGEAVGGNFRRVLIPRFTPSGAPRQLPRRGSLGGYFFRYRVYRCCRCARW